MENKSSISSTVFDNGREFGRTLTLPTSDNHNHRHSAMDSSQTMHPQAMCQSSFFYYNPEPSAEHRQLGHFTPHPAAVQDGISMHPYQQQTYYPDMMLQGQEPMMYPHLPSSGPQMYMQRKPILAMTSPRPTKPSFLYQYEGLPLSVDTECSTPDVYVYPSTPPLSASGSTSSSPPSTCGVIPTPVTRGFMGLDNIEGVKEGCEGDVQSEILAGGDWTRCCSPPLTPGMFCSSLFCPVLAHIRLLKNFVVGKETFVIHAF